MRSKQHEMYKDLQASSITFCHKAAMYSSLFAYYLLKYQTLRKINFEIFNITCPVSKQDTMIKIL